MFVDYVPLDDVHLPPDHLRPPGMPDIAWNPWTDVRKRDDVAALNVSFPYGPLPKQYQVKVI